MVDDDEVPQFGRPSSGASAEVSVPVLPAPSSPTENIQPPAAVPQRRGVGSRSQRSRGQPTSPTEMPVPTELPSPTSPAAIEEETEIAAHKADIPAIESHPVAAAAEDLE